MRGALACPPRVPTVRWGPPGPHSRRQAALFAEPVLKVLRPSLAVNKGSDWLQAVGDQRGLEFQGPQLLEFQPLPEP